MGRHKQARGGHRKLKEDTPGNHASQKHKFPQDRNLPMAMGSLSDLKPDPENRRKHPDRNVAMVVAALQEVGASRSIVVDEDGTILAGNGVVEAAKQAGLNRVRIVEADGQEVIAVRRRGLTDAQKRALAIYDNRTSELAEWNAEQLRLDAAAGLTLESFWTDPEQAILLGQPVDPSWNGMPDFHQDKLAWRSVVIHFRQPEDLAAFATLIGQTLSDKTKFLWFPPVPRDHVIGVKEFVSGE